MKTIYHAANSRGNADYGWLKSQHTFSFANYYNPDRMGFGALRVINDDYVLGGYGFGQHPHRDMEIISIPLSGKLNHADNMGNQGIIGKGEIQVMSAGTGVVHSEMNGDEVEPVKFLQIWVLPNKTRVEPRYQQIKLADVMKPNEFNQVLSPSPDDQGVWIHQDAWFNLGKFDKDLTKNYRLNKSGNGVYVFVINGSVEIDGKVLNTRDGLGIWDTDSFTMDTLDNVEILLMEVPM